jgi:hypothetical protein
LTITPQQGQAFTLPWREGMFLHQIFQASVQPARPQAKTFTSLPHAKRDDCGVQCRPLQACSYNSLEPHGHPGSGHV